MKKILLSFVVMIMTGAALPALKLGTSVGEFGAEFGSTEFVSILHWKVHAGYIKLMQFYLTSENKNIPLRFGVSLLGHRWDGETAFSSLFPVEIIYMPFNLRWLNVYGSAGMYFYQKQSNLLPLFVFSSNYEFYYAVGISLRGSFFDIKDYYIHNSKIFIEYRPPTELRLGLALDGSFFATGNRKQ